MDGLRNDANFGDAPIEKNGKSSFLLTKQYTSRRYERNENFEQNYIDGLTFEILLKKLG